MICQSCGQREATVKVRQTVKGKEESFNLCEQCAGVAGLMTKPGLNLWEDFFGTALPGPSLFGYPAPLRRERKPQLVCPSCGETEDELRETGLLGCPVCYDTFAPMLKPVFGRLHGHTGHIASLSRRLEGRELPDQQDSEQERLRRELARAVEGEAYEEAARIRDRIRALETEEDREAGG